MKSSLLKGIWGTQYPAALSWSAVWDTFRAGLLFCCSESIIPMSEFQQNSSVNHRLLIKHRCRMTLAKASSKTKIGFISPTSRSLDTRTRHHKLPRDRYVSLGAIPVTSVQIRLFDPRWYPHWLQKTLRTLELDCYIYILKTGQIKLTSVCLKTFQEFPDCCFYFLHLMSRNTFHYIAGSAAVELWSLKYTKVVNNTLVVPLWFFFPSNTGTMKKCISITGQSTSILHHSVVLKSSHGIKSSMQNTARGSCMPHVSTLALFMGIIEELASIVPEWTYLHLFP